MNSKLGFYGNKALDKFIGYVRELNIRDDDNQFDIKVEIPCSSYECGNLFTYPFNIDQLRTLKQLQSHGAGLTRQNVLNVLGLRQKCSECATEDERRLEVSVQECIDAL